MTHQTIAIIQTSLNCREMGFRRFEVPVCESHCGDQSENDSNENLNLYRKINTENNRDSFDT